MGEIYDVAVIGCGPVGAVAAHLFGQAGLRTLVVERESAPHPLPRAVHLDHEMMRIFQGLGLVERLAPLMRATHGHVHIGADGGVIRYLGAHGRPKRFGWSNDYFFYQPELEAELRAALERRPEVELRLGVELTGLVQDADAASLRLGEGASVRARYVVACDGARSAVRKAVGVGLDDLDFEEPWLVVDAEVDGPISFPDFEGLPAEADLQNLSVMLCDPRRPATIVPGRGAHRRWEFMLLPGEDEQAMTAPDRVAGLVAPWVEDAPHRIVRAATYRFHGLVAERWRVGRVFLAGDAAHQTPPFFGQGMCHGLRDVANLAWKLALVLGGSAEEGLLDTYQPERDPHVRAVIGAAVAAGRYICVLDPEAAAERDTRVREAARTAGAATAADLIPPIRGGAAREGAGERFIQPRVRGAEGRVGLLDDLTGGGWRVIVRDPAPARALSASAADRLARLKATLWTLSPEGGEGALMDVDGDLSAWFDAKGAQALVLRPDFYVYGLATSAEALETLLARLADDLRLIDPVGAQTREAATCSA